MSLFLLNLYGVSAHFAHWKEADMNRSDMGNRTHLHCSWQICQWLPCSHEKEELWGTAQFTVTQNTYGTSWKFIILWLGIWRKLEEVCGIFFYIFSYVTQCLSNSYFCCHMIFVWYCTIPTINKLFLKMYQPHSNLLFLAGFNKK